VTVNRIGVAAGAPDSHADELRRAVEAAARAISVRVERVESAEAARGCVLVLALGFPAWYPWLVDVDPGSVVTWYGEPLPPP
jgi:type II secretory pathway component PulM